MFEVIINGTTLDRLEQSNPLSYDDVKVWAATPKGDRDPPPAGCSPFFKLKAKFRINQQVEQASLWHFTTGGNCCDMDNRIPAIFLRDSVVNMNC